MMRFREVVRALVPVKLTDTAGEIIDEAEPQKPLNAKQATTRAAKLRAASAKVADVQAINSIKLQAMKRRLSDL